MRFSSVNSKHTYVYTVTRTFIHTVAVQQLTPVECICAVADQARGQGVSHSTLFESCAGA